MCRMQNIWLNCVCVYDLVAQSKATLRIKGILHKQIEKYIQGTELVNTAKFTFYLQLFRCSNTK